jgi:hypothetical protein
MLQNIFILIILLAVIFLLIAVYWQSIAFCSIDIVLWIILSISVFQIELPYTAILSDDTIISGVQTVETLYPLSWLFGMMALITSVYMMVTLIFPMLQGKFSKMM